ncbi:MAG TPA: hypothetical protein P5513_04765 [Candidatus Diapherotrites archaeon]|nr:hypothetical protein [Candidatus Diapherotrites archaeon]
MINFNLNKQKVLNRFFLNRIGDKAAVYFLLVSHSILDEETKEIISTITIDDISSITNIDKNKVLRCIESLLQSYAIREIKPDVFSVGYCLILPSGYRRYIYYIFQEKPKNDGITEVDINNFITYFREKYKEIYGTIYKQGGLQLSERKQIERVLKKLKNLEILPYTDYIDYLFKEIVPERVKRNSNPVTLKFFTFNDIFEKFIANRRLVQSACRKNLFFEFKDDFTEIHE